MDMIEEFAKDVKQNYQGNRFQGDQRVIDMVRNRLPDIDEDLDKIRFVNMILECNNKGFEKHKPKCTDPSGCIQNKAYTKVSYFLEQDLKRLGVTQANDAFTTEEKEEADSKLDQILKDLNELKLGHEIIYEDLRKELQELKDLFFLGKKKWHQVLLGKSVEMVVGGVISETTAKQIVESLKSVLPPLISNA